MADRPRTALVVGGVATAAVALAARAVRRRRAALAGIPTELLAPMAWLPLPVGPAVVRVARRLPALPTPVRPGVDAERRTVAAVGDTPVDVIVYRPAGRATPSGALVWIHGGGLVIGDVEGYHETCSGLAADLGILVVSVDYRLAPEHPFPAAVDDCYAALRWVHETADELGVDRSRIAVGGDSAGGGLAASLAQVAHDGGEVPVCFQLLVYPMLDDRTVLRHDHDGRGVAVWTPSANRYGWTAYLGHPPTAGPERPYAAAARRDDLTGLPPAWIGVGERDLFHDEDVDYARRLREAGVACELHVVPGMYHAAERFRPRVPSMAEFTRRLAEALRAGLAERATPTADPRAGG
ncbi:hypothetical protein GCM10023168_06030 [Fodinibacter luteus]|uniref:Alpha/beta hydrolase fold-3 domain-containing protein n=1 Tax=Fodinibacter luteus TaxID=552064 RepID=A0ABP8K200_9MICO